MAYFADNPNCPSNFLSGIGFQFSLKKLPGVSFYCQSANIPSQNLAVATQATRFNALPEPGDEINYDDLTIRFLVDEDLKNYMSIHNWLRYLGHPESAKDWSEYSDGDSYIERQYSDGVIFVLDSNFNRKFRIYFKDLFPVSLSGLNFDSTYTDTEYFAVDATFKFSIFDIEEVGATGFFTQADYPKPTVYLSHTLDSNNNVTLTWQSNDASYVTIDQGVGEATLSGSDTIPYSTVGGLMLNGAVTYTITAVGRGGTATASTTVTIGTPVTNATIVNIAVIDESDAQSISGMETKWTGFRSRYPDRNFYLLQPSSCTSYDALRCPPSFMEETDPTSITNVCGGSSPVTNYDSNFGHYTSTTQGTVETPTYNNSTADTFSNISKYGVFVAGLESGCGSLTDMITAFSTGNDLSTVLNYINAGGVFWFKSEWIGGGCANHANVNTILTLMGSTIRINGESATSGDMNATPAASNVGFPATLFHNATGLFDNGEALYTVAAGNTWVYERMGNGILVCSADVNTFQAGVYTLRPPVELYNALRALV